MTCPQCLMATADKEPCRYVISCSFCGWSVSFRDAAICYRHDGKSGISVRLRP